MAARRLRRQKKESMNSKRKLLVNERKIIIKEKPTWAQTMTGVVWACLALVLSSRRRRCQMWMVGDAFVTCLVTY